MMTQAAAAGPLAILLPLLAQANLDSRVAYTLTPPDASPPRLQIGLPTGADLARFSAAVQRLCDTVPASILPLTAHVLDEVVGMMGTVFKFDLPPHAVKFLVEGDLARLIRVVEDHGPVKVTQPAPRYRDHLLSIAAIALQAAIQWDRDNAPGEAGDVPPPTLDDVVGDMLAEGTRIAACRDGLDDLVVVGPVVTCDTCRRYESCERPPTATNCWEGC